MTTKSKSGREVDADTGALQAQRAEITRALGDHYFWLPRVLARARAWEWLVPWPGLWLFQLARGGRVVKIPTGSLWLTADIGVYLYASIATGSKLEVAALQYAPDIAKALFSGAFLVGTILSVSVAMPGQAILRLVLGRDPDFAINFVVPSLWAFLWGVFAGVLMTFFRGLEHAIPQYSATGVWLQRAALAIAMYAASMIVNAILFTIRMYLVGLIQSSAEPVDEQDNKQPASDPDCEDGSG